VLRSGHEQRRLGVEVLVDGVGRHAGPHRRTGGVCCDV
jgi:hypothetical protein